MKGFGQLIIHRTGDKIGASMCGPNLTWKNEKEVLDFYSSTDERAETLVEIDIERCVSKDTWKAFLAINNMSFQCDRDNKTTGKQDFPLEALFSDLFSDSFVAGIAFALLKLQHRK